MLGKWCHNSTTSFSQTLDLGPIVIFLDPNFYALLIGNCLILEFFFVIVLGSES